jgi:hypothetical protein
MNDEVRAPGTATPRSRAGRDEDVHDRRSDPVLRALDWLLVAAYTIGGGIFAGTILWLLTVR